MSMLLPAADMRSCDFKADADVCKKDDEAIIFRGDIAPEIGRVEPFLLFIAVELEFRPPAEALLITLSCDCMFLSWYALLILRR